MTYQTAISMLAAARNGAEMLQVLDQLMSLEAPQVAQVSAAPTLEAVEF